MGIHEILAFVREWDHDSYLQEIHDSSDNVQSFGAEINETPASSYPPLPLPTQYTVIGVDGSHIDVNRHIPVSCFLTNTGAVTFRYGSELSAGLGRNPVLYSGHSNTTVIDPC